MTDYEEKADVAVKAINAYVDYTGEHLSAVKQLVVPLETPPAPPVPAPPEAAPAPAPSPPSAVSSPVTVMTCIPCYPAQLYGRLVECASHDIRHATKYFQRRGSLLDGADEGELDEWEACPSEPDEESEHEDEHEFFHVDESWEEFREL